MAVNLPARNEGTGVARRFGNYKHNKTVMKNTMKMYLILSGLVLCLATGWTQDAPTREERHAGDLGNIVADILYGILDPRIRYD